jgi:hypothetical protein
MMKGRLSASIDADLLAAAERAVSEGRAENVSAWVNAALRRQADHDRRMHALTEFVAAYEAKHGVISDKEISTARRRARAGATVVRSGSTKRRSA